MNLSMKFPTERVQELEAELKEVRTAFEQYVANSKELESALDKELSELRTYCNIWPEGLEKETVHGSNAFV